MKKKSKYAKKFVGYDNNAPTAWVCLFVLMLASLSFANVALAKVYSVEVDAAGFRAEVAHAEELADRAAREADRQGYLVELRKCESSQQDKAVGDGGDSNGQFQVQKETLETWLGRKVTTAEYYSIVRNLHRVQPLVYDALFERGESWRWVICTKKVNAMKSWTL